MRFHRRAVLTLPLSALAAAPFAADGLAQSIPPARVQLERALPPIIFVHGNGDYAALWQTVLWRFESNGYDRNKLFAFDFTDPTAVEDDAVAQPNRSTAAEQVRELAVQVDRVLRATGAPKVALVGSSRGGIAIRIYIASDGAARNVSHAILCGTPNHGVFVAESSGSEFNGRGPILSKLNAQPGEITDGPAWLTLRSDGMDKYAQPDGRFIGRPGVPTGVGFDGPELKGAFNVVLGALDHRETAFHPRAFREMFKFITGREPGRLDIVPEEAVQLSGLVTGLAGSAATNRPLPGTLLQIFVLSAESAERQGNSVYEARTDNAGRWGAARVPVGVPVEFVLTAENYPVTHIYRSGFPRSSAIVHLRPGRPLASADKDASAVAILSRPRGYFGIPRDVVLFDGKQPADVKPGVPTDSVTTLRLDEPPGRTVGGVFNEERIVCRTWPARDNHLTIAELTY